MIDLKDYWKRIRETERHLREQFPTGAVFVTSIENPDTRMPGGIVTSVTVATAARCIINRTHTVASEAEISAYVKRHQLAGRAIEARQSQLQRVNKTPPVTRVRLEAE